MVKKGMRLILVLILNISIGAYLVHARAPASEEIKDSLLPIRITLYLVFFVIIFIYLLSTSKESGVTELFRRDSQASAKEEDR